MCQFGKQPWWLELACTSPSKLPPQWLPLTCTTSSQQPGDGCPASEGEGSSCTAWLCCQPFLRSHYPSSFLLMAFWLRSLDRDHTHPTTAGAPGASLPPYPSQSLLSEQVHNPQKQPIFLLNSSKGLLPPSLNMSDRFWSRKYKNISLHVAFATFKLGLNFR